MKILNFLRVLKKTYVYISLSLPIIAAAVLFSKPQPTSFLVPNTKPPLFAFSVDYQNCLANPPYRNQCVKLLTTSPPAPLKADWNAILIPYYNLRALGFIAKTVRAMPNSEKTPILFLNGSNRQFFKTIEDQLGSLNYFEDAPLPLALKSIESLTRSVQTLLDQKSTVQINKILLGDIYNQKELGFTWKLAQQAIVHTPEEAVPLRKEYIDKSKFDIVYSQIHQLRQTHPNHQIHFHFLDNNENILSRLKIFFEKNPDLIPVNVALSLVHYDGDHLSFTACIKGVGICDVHYRESILSTYQQFREKESEAKLDKLSLFSQPESLLRFKTQRESYLVTSF